eukprot:s1479_g5.t2
MGLRVLFCILLVVVAALSEALREPSPAILHLDEGNEWVAGFHPRRLSRSCHQRILLKARRSAGDSRRLARRLFEEVDSGLEQGSWHHLTRVGIDIAEIRCGQDVNQTIALIKEKLGDQLDFVELDEEIYMPLQAVVDPVWPQQWGPQRVGFENAWIQLEALEVTPSEVVVALIDTGFNFLHEDIQGRVWVNEGEIAGNGIDDDGNGFVDDVNGFNFVDNNGRPEDDSGHGTHNAGIIAAQVNDLGVAGAAGRNQMVKLMIVKALTANGGYKSDAINALNYAMAMGAEISSNSWGGHSESLALQTAIQVAMEAGHLFVSAAGNDNRNADLSPFYPCVYPHVLCVAASDDQDQFTFFSNYGEESIELVAPGQSIISTYLENTQYASLTGTSFGTSMVAGAAALLFSWLRSATNTVQSVEDIRWLLLETAEKLSWTEGFVGNGMLDVDAAASKALSGVGYSWLVGPWSLCRTESCTTSQGIRARNVSCVSSDGTEVDIAECSEEAECQDLVLGWRDSYDASCSIYESYNWCTSTGNYASGWLSSWGTFTSTSTTSISSTSSTATITSHTQTSTSSTTHTRTTSTSSSFTVSSSTTVSSTSSSSSSSSTSSTKSSTSTTTETKSSSSSSTSTVTRTTSSTVTSSTTSTTTWTSTSTSKTFTTSTSSTFTSTSTTSSSTTLTVELAAPIGTTDYVRSILLLVGTNQTPAGIDDALAVALADSFQMQRSSVEVLSVKAAVAAQKRIRQLEWEKAERQGTEHEEVAVEEEDLDRPQTSRRRKLPQPPPVPKPKAAPKAATPRSVAPPAPPLPSASRPGLRLGPPTLRLLPRMGEVPVHLAAQAQQAQQAQQAARQAEAMAAMERERAGQRLLQAFAAAPSAGNSGYNWRESSTWQNGKIQIHMAHWELSEEHWTQWLQWMQNEWTRRSAEYTWEISTMDLSHNVLTPPAVEKICEFLDGKLVCHSFDFSNTSMCDQGLIRLVLHLASTGVTEHLNISDNKDITFTGVSWLFTILSWHPLYPSLANNKQGRPVYSPLKVKMENLGFPTSELNTYLDSNEFKLLCTSVTVGSSFKSQFDGPNPKKHNVVFQLDVGLASESRRILNPYSMVKCSDQSMVAQPPRPCRAKLLTQKPAHQRMEPQVVFEDYDLMVITKPPWWHCTNCEHGPEVLSKVRELDVSNQREEAEKLLLKSGTAALHDYIILRFGKDPLLAGVLNPEMLWGLIHRLDTGTSGCLLMAKNQEAWEMAKKDCYTQRFVRDYVALAHGSVRLHCKGEYRNQHRGLISAAIDRSQYAWTRRVEVNPSGKGEASQTQYECLAEYKSANGFHYTLLHLRLLTGRTHQIREHIGLPLVGDHEYQRRRPPFDAEVTYCQRPFLHKLRFVFPNRRGDPAMFGPIGGRRMVEAPSDEVLENTAADPRRALRAASLEPALETDFQILLPEGSEVTVDQALETLQALRQDPEVLLPVLGEVMETYGLTTRENVSLRFTMPSAARVESVFVASLWGDCAGGAVCSNLLVPLRYRDVWCARVADLASVEPDAFCSGAKPRSSEPCPEGIQRPPVCGWQISNWSSCMAVVEPCNGQGVQRREAVCLSVPPDECGEAPETQRECQCVAGATVTLTPLAGEGTQADDSILLPSILGSLLGLGCCCCCLAFLCGRRKAKVTVRPESLEAAQETTPTRKAVAELLAECEERQISTKGCLERQDLEDLLKESKNSQFESSTLRELGASPSPRIERPSSPMSPSRIQHCPVAAEDQSQDDESDVNRPKPRASPHGSEVSTHQSGSPISSKSSTGLERPPSVTPDSPVASQTSPKAKEVPKPPPLVPELLEAPMEASPSLRPSSSSSRSSPHPSLRKTATWSERNVATPSSSRSPTRSRTTLGHLADTSRAAAPAAPRRMQRSMTERPGTSLLRPYKTQLPQTWQRDDERYDQELATGLAMCSLLQVAAVDLWNGEAFQEPNIFADRYAPSLYNREVKLFPSAPAPGRPRLHYDY